MCHPLCCVPLLAAVIAAPVGAAEQTLYVATNGRDSWSGTLAAPNAAATDGPFASLSRARDAVRQLAAGGRKQPVTVYLRGGLYPVTETVVFGPQDSGTPECPVTYAAYQNEQPILAGGRRVTGWQRGADGVATVELPEVKAGRWYFRQLFAGGQRQIRARYPNVDPTDPHRKGYTYVAADATSLTGVVGNIHNVGDWMEYDLKVPADGEYDVWLYYGHNMKTYQVPDMGGHTTLSVDGGPPVPLTNMPDTGSWGTYAWAKVARLKLTAGDRVLKWQNQKGGGLGLVAFLLSDAPDYRPQGTQPAPAPAGRHHLLVRAEKFRAFQGKQLSVSGFAGGGSKDTIPCSPGTIKPAWSDAPDAEVHIWPSDPHSCRAFKLIVQVTAADEAKQTLKVKGPECIVAMYPGDRFFVDNLPSELDAPGEWYLDRRRGRLSFRPPTAADLDQVIAPAVRHIVRLDGDAKANQPVHDVRFRGLTFGFNDYAPGDGGVGYQMGNQGTVHLTAARNIVVEDCAFPCSGLYAIAATGSSACRFVGNRITDSAQGGVLLLDSDHMAVTDNTILNVGVIYKHIGGVVLDGPKTSDNLIAHNLIRDSSRYGISIKSGGFRNVIEYNAVHDTSTETHDTGAIEVTQQERDKLAGSHIRYNLVSNSGGYSSRFEVPVLMSWCIYLDSFAGGYTVDHNICWNSHTGGVMLQGGKQNKVFNNIFVDAETCQLLFANFADNTRGSEFRRNIVYTRDPKARLFSHGKLTPEVLQADHNLYWQVGVDLQQADGELARWRKLGYDANAVVADPLFVDAAQHDYRLRPESPALKLGFEPIDTSQIGPRPRR